MSNSVFQVILIQKMEKLIQIRLPFPVVMVNPKKMDKKYRHRRQVLIEKVAPIWGWNTAIREQLRRNSRTWSIWFLKLRITVVINHKFITKNYIDDAWALFWLTKHCFTSFHVHPRTVSHKILQFAMSKPAKRKVVRRRKRTRDQNNFSDWYCQSAS